MWRTGIFIALFVSAVVAQNPPVAPVDGERSKQAQARLNERQRQREEADNKPVTQAEFRKVVQQLRDEIEDLRAAIAAMRKQIKSNTAPAGDAAAPADVAKAIKEGRLLVGMTRDQVQQSLSRSVRYASRTKYVAEGIEDTEWGPEAGADLIVGRVDYIITFKDGRVSSIRNHGRAPGRSSEVSPTRSGLSR